MRGSRAVAVLAAGVVVALVVLAVVLIGGRQDDGGGRGEARSTMQVRPVLGEDANCTAMDENPDPLRAARLSHRGRCIGLGQAALTVRRAGVSRPIPGPNGVLRVQVNLTPDDARTFAELTRDYQGKQVAIVAFGRVLVAPVIGEPVINGQMELSGLTEAEAEELRTVLG